MQPDAEAASWRDDSDYVTPPSSGGKQQHEAPPPARRLMNWRPFVRISLQFTMLMYSFGFVFIVQRLQL